MSARLMRNIAAALLVVLPSLSAAMPAGEPGNVRDLATANSAFALDLYATLGKAEKGNLSFSPYGISTALAMAYGGARGDTAKEMRSVLRFKADPARLHAAFKDLGTRLAAAARNAGQKLSIANAMILLPGRDVSDAYKRLLRQSYDAALFSGGLDEVNAWVNGKTEGRIPRILERLDPDSVCVLVNALYFKGTWNAQFKKSRTQVAPFMVSAHRKVPVALMNQTADLSLLEEKEFQAVSIPYRGNRTSMVVMLPRDTEGLARLESQLNPQNLRQWLSRLRGQRFQKVDLYLPKYKLETSYDLVDVCRSLGMKKAFSKTQADFTGMGLPRGAFGISKIKHKTFLEVDEEGTEATAATAVVVGITAAVHPVFRADHPFIFMIIDEETDSLLFMGRVADPRGN